LIPQSRFQKISHFLGMSGKQFDQISHRWIEKTIADVLSARNSLEMRRSGPIEAEYSPKFDRFCFSGTATLGGVLRTAMDMPIPAETAADVRKLGITTLEQVGQLLVSGARKLLNGEMTLDGRAENAGAAGISSVHVSLGVTRTPGMQFRKGLTDVSREGSLSVTNQSALIQ